MTSRTEAAAISVAVLYVLVVGVQVNAANINIGLGDPLVPLLFILCGARVVPRLMPRWSALILAVLAANAFALGLPTQYVWLQKVAGWGFLVATAMLLTMVITDLDRFDRLLNAYMHGGLVLTAIGLVAYLLVQASGIAIPWLNFGERLSATMPDPNAFGSLLVILLGIELGSDWSKGRGGRLWTFGVRSLLLVSLLLTFSRTAWGGFVVVCGVLAVYRGKSLVPQFAAAVVAGVIAIRLLSEGAVEQGVALATRARQVQSRLDIVSQSWDEFQSSPLFGIGLGNFPARHEYIVHNSPLWFAVNMGLAGIILGWSFLLSPILQANRARRLESRRGPSRSLGLVAALVGITVCSLGIEALYQRHWWVLIALARALVLLLQDRSSQLAPVVTKKAIYA